MIRSFRERGPVVLIPAAWTAVGATEFEYLSTDGLFVAHLVMAAFIGFFLLTGWSELSAGALRAWRVVLLVGFGLTLAGIAGFLVDTFETALLATSLFGWMVLPAGGLAYTALELPEARLVYGGGALVSVLGACVFAVALVWTIDPGLVAGLALVAVGQTAGIVDAARR
ncbi:hypothetical protein [Halovenus marina]|uniref:hypothetical protein n=1 Tax=Halovenus marina TaxID=3396621 RepID=UPI003F57C910